MPSPPHKATLAPVVKLEQVSFAYPLNPVLQQVSLAIYPGQFIGIIGPNGGGKTTLLKLILGFLSPSQGVVQVFNQNPAERTKMPLPIAYVPQALFCDRHFPISAEEVVLTGLCSRLPWYGRFRTADRRAAQGALEKIGLAHLSGCPFGKLSGGQAQRVLIARALVSDPKLLLLDEPTASVDHQAEVEIYALLEQLKGTRTILMVTHDLRAALEHVEALLCVQGHVAVLKPTEVCPHFSFGLYQR